MEAQEEIAQIKETRKARGGRYTKIERARLDELEAQMNAALEGAESAAETPSGNGRVISVNLTVPTPDGARNAPQGAIVNVPEDFLEAMVKFGRMERV